MVKLGESYFEMLDGKTGSSILRVDDGDAEQRRGMREGEWMRRKRR